MAGKLSFVEMRESLSFNFLFAAQKKLNWATDFITYGKRFGEYNVDFCNLLTMLFDIFLLF